MLVLSPWSVALAQWPPRYLHVFGLTVFSLAHGLYCTAPLHPEPAVCAMKAVEAGHQRPPLRMDAELLKKHTCTASLRVLAYPRHGTILPQRAISPPRPPARPHTSTSASLWYS